MSNEAITISDAELEIMKALWRGRAPMNTQAISSAVAHKAWKRTTIATLLTRLVEKGPYAPKSRESSTAICRLSQKRHIKIADKKSDSNAL